MDERQQKFEELIAKALTGVDAEELRTILAEVVRERIKSYDCERMLSATIDPLVRSIALEVLKDEAIQEGLRARVRSEVHRLVSGVELKSSRY